MTSPKSPFQIYRVDTDFPASDLENGCWDLANPIVISRNWNGSTAETARHFSASGLWSDTAVYFRFLANQNEPLVVSSEAEIDKKTLGLWERDVCEVFIGPDLNQPKQYFEFEVAPTGEWIDLALDSRSGERMTDWEYHSRMEAAARIENHRVLMAVKIPWAAFGRKPMAGDVWLGNIFRCVGKEPNRGYLAWQPTLTGKANFHVPDKFGRFKFES